MLETRLSETDNGFLHQILSIKNLFDVTRVSSISGFSREDLGVAIAYRPNSKVMSQSAGKGVHQNQAFISAIMESFECHSAENIGPDLVAPQDQLGTMASDPKQMSITTLDYDYSSNQRWVLSTDLINNRKVFIPFESVSLDFRELTDSGCRTPFYRSSNGLASGSSEDDAIRSALYEIVERHSITINELMHTDKKQKVGDQSIESSVLSQLYQKLKAYNTSIKVDLYDNTIFAQFPTYKCILFCDDRRWVGYGTHSNGVTAATRAITEANQARLIEISGAREDMNKELYLYGYPELTSTNRVVEEVGLRNIDVSTSLTSRELVDQLKTMHHKPLYLFRYPQQDDHVHVVRLVSEGLHGYLVPGYQHMSILANNLVTPTAPFHIDKHSPAAGL